MSDSNPMYQKPFHHLVQLAYVNTLFAEKSVLLVGGDFSLAAYIASTGANVVAVDTKEPEFPWPELRADDGMACHVMPLDNLAFNDGVFGAAVIPDLGALTEPEAVLAEVGRVLGRNGHLIVAIPNNRDSAEVICPIDYYKFFELLSFAFPSVQMIGQSQFSGYAIQDLSNKNGELEIGFTSELLGNEAEEIAWFAAVCGTRPAEIESYSIIQVPSSGAARSSEVFLRLEEELKNARRELGNRGVRIESLEKKLEEELMQSEAARERAVKLAKDLDNERKAVTKKTLEDEFSKRSADIDLAGALHSAKKEIRLAEERAQSAEAARDGLIERMREDAAELDKLRRKLSDLETAPRRDMEAEKRARLAEERANSAEAARDQLIEQMRSDTAELDRLRDKLQALDVKLKNSKPNPEAEKRARVAEERAQSAEAARDQLIEQMRSDTAELDRLRDKLTALDEKLKSVEPNLEMEKQVRLTEERAQSAEAARDRLIEQMRSDTAELEKLHEEREALQRESEKMREELAVVRESKTALQAETDALRSEVDALRARISDLELTIAEVSAVKAVECQPAAAAPDRTSVSPEATFAEEFTAIENENALLEGRLKAAADERLKAEEEVKRLNAMIRDLIVKIESLQQVNTVMAPISDSGVPAQSDDVRELESQIAALWGAKAGEHRARVEAELELTGKMLELKALKGNLADANVQLKLRDEEIRRLAEDTHALEDALSAMTSKCSAMKTAFDEELVSAEGTIKMRVAELETELQSSKWHADELSARKKDMEVKLDALSLRLEEVSSENQRLSTLLESEKRRERMLDEENESLTSRAKSLRTDLEELQGKAESLSGDLAASQADRERLTETLRNMERQLEEERNLREQREDELKATAQNSEKVHVTLIGREVELKGAHEKISDLTRVVDSLKDESGRIAELLDALNRKQTEVTALRESLTAKESALSDESERTSALQMTLDALRAELMSESEMTKLAGADAARASGEVACLKEKLERSAADILEKDAEIETGLNVIAALREEVIRVTGKLESVRIQDRKTDMLSLELEALRKRSAILSDELSKSRSELEVNLSELEGKKKEMANIAVELSRKDAVLEDRDTAFNEQAKALKEREEELRQKETALSDLSGTLDALKKKEMKLLAELADRRMEIEESAESMSEMEAKIVAVNQAKVGMSGELAEAISNAERLSTEIETLKQQNAEFASEASVLKSKIERLTYECADADELRRRHTALKADFEILKSKVEELDSLCNSQKEFALQVKSLASQLEDVRKSDAEKESLINSLTEQLEERERRSAMLERQVRALNERIEEHEGDVSAWDMELKLRNARISQLEKELAEAGRK